MALVISSGPQLRRYTIGLSASKPLPEDRTLAIDIWPMPAEQMQQAVSAAMRDARVRAALDKEQGAVFTAHVLPEDYGMTNLFADVGPDHRMFSRLSLRRFKYLLSFAFPFCEYHRKNQIMGSPQENYKVAFSL